jgi:hypothetical protein
MKFVVSIKTQTYYTLEIGMDLTHLQGGWVENTEENFGSSKIYGSRTVRKPKDRNIDAMIEDVRKLSGKTGQKEFALDRKILRLKTENSGAWHWAFLP